MKKILTILVLLIFLAGCKRTSGVHGDGLSFWSPLIPEHDSIVELLDRSFLYLEDDSVKSALLMQLEHIAALHENNRQLQARTYIMKGRVLRRLENLEEARKSLHYARLLCDSVSYPYDMERLRYEEGAVNVRPLVIQYMDDLNSQRFFQSIGDSVMVAALYISMGSTFLNIFDTIRARDYLEKADRIFDLMNLEKMRIFNKVNLSLVCEKEGDVILRQLRQMSEVRSNKALYNMVLYNSYACTDSVIFLKTILDRGYIDERYDENRARMEALIATKQLDKNIAIDSSLMLASRAWDNYDESWSDITRFLVTQGKALAVKIQGKTDSAMLLNDKKTDLYCNMMENKRGSDILAVENRMKIADLERIHQERLETERNFKWIIVAAVMFCAFVIVSVFYLRWKKAKISEMKSKVELERDRMRLATSQLALEGKDKAMESMMSIIDDMKRRGSIQTSVADEMSAKIKLTVNDNEEMETFREVYSRLNPYFVKRLKEKCPNLTENQTKLAAYIAIGLSNRQIARLLSIDHQSVIKGRYRLRSKLALERSASLEDELRKYADV